MKYAIIDIGSNSVRMLINEDGASVFKETKITKLAKDMIGCCLDLSSIERTFNAIAYFVDKAHSHSVDKISCFATAAMRKAKNAYLLTDKVKRVYALDVDIITGEEEAYLGALGALDGFDGGVIDIGGASSEIAVITNGKLSYSYSLPIGAVSLTNKFSQDYEKSYEFLFDKVKEYKDVVCQRFFAIGGTATSIAAIEQQLHPYDSTKTHGYVIQKENLVVLVNKLFNTPVKERALLKGLQPERADVIAQGSLILLMIMDYLKLDHVTVSEKDNLDGYFLEKTR